MTDMQRSELDLKKGVKHCIINEKYTFALYNANLGVVFFIFLITVLL